MLRKKEGLQMTDTEKLILEKLEELSKDMASVKQKVTSIEITLENDTNRKIDIIGEGHDFLKQRLDQALQMEKKRESMELELINLRMEIKKIKQKLDIA